MMRLTGDWWLVAEDIPEHKWSNPGAGRDNGSNCAPLHPQPQFELLFNTKLIARVLTLYFFREIYRCD